MQLDIEEGEVFVPPAGVMASPDLSKPSDRPESRDSEGEGADLRAAAEAARKMEG